MCDIKLLYIDLFCGAGGTSTGVENAKFHGKKCAKVVACVDHDANAIASHAANHQEALHFTADIKTLELSPLVKHVAEMKDKYPYALVAIWSSLECTNFSKAKGGKPRDADSRTLAEHLFRYIESLNPDFIYIENVEEFIIWGDIDEKGKPIREDAGRLYQKWIDSVKGYGYNFDNMILNSADFGAYTSRKRFFGIFAKTGLPIVFPDPTHSKTGETGLFCNLEKWKPVKDVLDFSDEGESIFVRKKPLVDATLERIYAGLIKFVAGGKDAFLSRYNAVDPIHTAKSDEPATTVDKYSLVNCKYWIMNPQFSNAGGSVEKPCFTLIARMDKMPPYLITTEEGSVSIMIEENDTPAIIKIKEFMALYEIDDIKMRMLRIHEMKSIMGFKKEYTLIGTQAEQKKFIGNAVEVTIARKLCEALVNELESR